MAIVVVTTALITTTLVMSLTVQSAAALTCSKKSGACANSSPPPPPHRHPHPNFAFTTNNFASAGRVSDSGTNQGTSFASSSNPIFPCSGNPGVFNNGPLSCAGELAGTNQPTSAATSSPFCGGNPEASKNFKLTCAG